jgi:UV radiation resistance-associated gene protein
VDDLELTTVRRRARKISQSSVAALNNVQLAESSIESTNADHPASSRVRAISRASIGKGSTVRPHHARASSSFRMNDSSALVPSMQPSYLSTFMQDNSQRNLEKIISRRLTETFLAIKVPNDAEAPHHTIRPGTEEPPSLSSSQTSGPFPNGTTHGQNDAPRNSSPVRMRQASQTSARRPSASSSSYVQPTYDPIPVYLSSIHRPSTNPSFNVDARAGYDFAPWANTGGEVFRIEIWAPILQSQDKGKGKAVDGDQNLGSDEWAMREKWDVDLKNVVPFEGDVSLFMCSGSSNCSRPRSASISSFQHPLNNTNRWWDLLCTASIKLGPSFALSFPRWTSVRSRINSEAEP